jgi:heme/copper-type cytochrome/quinol oxidase subunit 2
MKALRLAFFVGLLVLELSSIVAVFFPSSAANSPVDGHWEHEVPFSNAWWLPFASILVVVVFVSANVGVLIAIWRVVKELRANG